MNTKESRIQSRDYQFNKLIQSGYARETYKTVDFFTNQDGKYFTLKAFKGTSANHIEYKNYHSEERRAEVIQNMKNNFDRNQEWKAEQKAKGQTSNHAGASASIKRELMAAFPNVKFSCTSESFSMGDSVNVSWNDGPTVKEVSAISNKYQYGHFDGMTDMYEYSNRDSNLPQAKYVSESRSMSEETRSLLTPIAEAIFNEIKESGNEKPFNCWDASQFLHQIFYNCSINGKVLGIVPTGVTCGLASPEVFYKIECEQLEVKPQATAPQYTEVEKVSGEINIVDYSEKAFAVIGDTKPIKDQLKSLGGSFNPRLTCGAGWIFSKKRLADVTKALQGEQEPIQEEEQQIIEESPRTLEQAKAELKDEVKKTIEFFAEHDIKTTGEISESTKEVARVQNVDLFTIKEEAPENYTNLTDINNAVKEGKVISLFNLSEIVNQKRTVN